MRPVFRAAPAKTLETWGLWRRWESNPRGVPGGSAQQAQVPADELADVMEDAA